jgi:tetratricopeptide (TPR) repeat protein/DNA-binding XRE family transcriptional regulator
METPSCVAFGTLLRRYRIAAGLTQEELAERAGISRRSLGDMERGVVHTPRKDTVTLLTAALALSPQERAALAEAARRLGTLVVPVPSPVVPSTPPFVGRARELALLERHLGASRAGSAPPLLLLAGEPGIGKTRLLHAAAPRAVAQGWCVLEGGCQRRGGHEPYAPFLGALQHHLRPQTSAQLRTALAGCAWLVRLLPELVDGPIEPLPAWALPPEQERRLMVAAVARFLGNVAGPAGTLLLLDDLQWAGPDALDLLTALVRAAADVPLRVIGAYRDTEVRPGDPLGIMLADLAHAGLVVHHTLSPLTPAEAGHLLAGLLADVAGVEPVLPQVVQRAGGVPFFLVSYARGLQTGVGAAIPWDLAQGLRQRVAALPAGAQKALGVAAVIGRVVPRRLLAAVLARPEDEVLAALDVACAAQLVREEGAEAYHFLHDVIREVVEADLGAAQRAVLHRRVAEALEGEPGERPIEPLAYHYSQGESWARALEYLVQAGDKAAAAYANQDALDFYVQALAVCEKLGDAALPTVLLVAQKRGDIHMLIQHPQDAIGDYDRMAEAARRLGDRRLEGLALAYRGWAEEEHHEFETAEATLRAALAVGAEGYDAVRVAASVRLTHCLAVVGRKAEAEALLREAGELAQKLGDPSMQQVCDVFTELFYIWNGRFDDALAPRERWDAAVADVRPADMVGQRWTEALARGGKGEYAQALGLLHDVVTTGERIGEVFAWRRALNTLGWLYGELQDHERALEWNTRGVQAARERGAPETTPECENNARLNLADTLLALGRLQDAAEQFRAVEQAVRTPRPQDRYMLWRYAQHLFHSYGELWLARGNPDQALVYADECLALAEPTNSRKYVAKGRRLRGQALLAQDRLAEAEQELDTALRIAQQVGNPCQLWSTYAARGDLRRAQGRAQDARTAYHAALAIIDSVAASLTDASLRETFLTSAHVQHIRQTEQACTTPQNAPSRDASVPARPSLPARQGVVPGTPAGRGLSRTERQAWAMEHLRTAGPLSPRAYATALGVSVDTALRDLQELVDRGLVQAAGTTRDRRYVLAGEAVGPAIHRIAP